MHAADVMLLVEPPDSVVTQQQQQQHGQGPVYAVVSAGLVVISLFMGLRLYTTAKVTRSVGIEDCESKSRAEERREDEREGPCCCWLSCSHSHPSSSKANK